MRSSLKYARPAPSPCIPQSQHVPVIGTHPDPASSSPQQCQPDARERPPPALLGSDLSKQLNHDFRNVRAAANAASNPSIPESALPLEHFTIILSTPSPFPSFHRNHNHRLACNELSFLTDCCWERHSSPSSSSGPNTRLRAASIPVPLSHLRSNHPSPYLRNMEQPLRRCPRSAWLNDRTMAMVLEHAGEALVPPSSREGVLADG